MNYIKALLEYDYEKSSPEIILTIIHAIEIEKQTKGSVFFWDRYLWDCLKKSNINNAQKLHDKYKDHTIVKEICARAEVMRIFKSTPRPSLTELNFS